MPMAHFKRSRISGGKVSRSLIRPLSRPPGLVQPIRGFGQVWREQLGGLRATIGWATEPEQGVSGTVRLWDGGLVVRIGADSYVLMADGSWLSFHP